MAQLIWWIFSEYLVAARRKIFDEKRKYSGLYQSNFEAGYYSGCLVSAEGRKGFKHNANIGLNRVEQWESGQRFGPKLPCVMDSSIHGIV